MFDALTLSLALGWQQYTEDGPYSIEPEPSLRVQVGHEESPLYVWGQYEEATVRILGQGVGDSSITSVGLGARKSIGEFFVFGELGYGMVDEGNNKKIQQEVVYTDLLLNHRVDFRPPPVYPQNDYDQDSYETLWELDDGLLGEVGVGYQKGDWSASVGYRPFYVREHVELWDEEQRAAGGGWWQESRSRDLSSWRFSVSYTF